MQTGKVIIQHNDRQHLNWAFVGSDRSSLRCAFPLLVHTNFSFFHSAQDSIWIATLVSMQLSVTHTTFDNAIEHNLTHQLFSPVAFFSHAPPRPQTPLLNSTNLILSSSLNKPLTGRNWFR